MKKAKYFYLLRRGFFGGGGSQGSTYIRITSEAGYSGGSATCAQEFFDALNNASSLDEISSIVLTRGAASKSGDIAAWNPQAQEIVSLGVTQATTNLSRVNEQGVYENVSANVLPRDFVNGGCGEFNIWPQRTNLVPFSLPNSANLAANGWSLRFTSGSPTATNVNFSLFGAGNNAIRYQQGASDRIFDLVTISLDASSTYQVSLYLDIDNSSSASTSDVLASLQGFSGLTGTTSITFGDFDTTTKRAVIEVTTSTATSGSLRLGPGSSTGNYVSDVILTGWQIEKGDYVSAPILSTSSTAESRDAIVVSQSGLSALLGQSGGGLYFEARPFVLSGIQSFTLSDGSNDNRVQAYFTATQIGLDVVSASVVQASMTAGSPSSSTFNKVCARYTTDDFTLHLGGSRVAQDTSGITFSGSVLNKFNLASATGASSQFYGAIRNLVVFNNVPTEAQANSLTT